MNKKKIKYPDGGTLPTSNSGRPPQIIVMGEEVIPGSARHKELLAKEEQVRLYNEQQKHINSFGITPTTLTADKFNSKYKSLEESFIPPTSGSVYNYGKKVIPEANPSLGLVPFTYGPTGEQFLTGMANPGTVPNYDLVEPDYGDMTLIPEKPYELPKPVVTPSPYMKQAPGAYYKNEGGTGEFAPKDAIWQEETGTYYDATTGKIYNPRSGAITTDPNWKSTVKEGTSISSQPIIENTPMPGFTPSSGTTVKMAGGGKFGDFFTKGANQIVDESNGKFKKHLEKITDPSRIGDTFKIAGDTLLSTIGLSDVIGDQAYKNQGFADASRVAEKVGGYTGQIVGNIIAPGVGGQVVKQAQNVLGNVDGTDERREYMDNISSLQSQGQLGKFNNAAYSTPDYIQPAMAITTGIGELGNAIAGQGIEGMQNPFQTLGNTMSSLPTFGCGGSIKKMADGGEFIEYNGATHAEGGIPIDQNGQPTVPQMAQAEVEGGETMHDDGIDKYIFSDRLMQDPKSKITFADASKKINRKYKDINDPYQKQARELELNRLKQEQEIFKSTIAGTQNNQQTPMFAKGGPLQKMYEDPNLGNDFNLDWSPNDIPYINQNQNMINRSPIENVYTPADLPSKFEQFTPLSPEELDRRQAESLFNTSGQVYFDPNDNILAPEENYSLQEEKYIEGTTPKEYEKAKAYFNQSGLPQDKINPLGFAASNMGNVYDLFQAARPLEKNKFDKVNLNTINLESQRRELEKQAGLARDTNRESVRNLATSSGQALGNQIVGNALINSSLGSGLSQSFLNEATTNTGIKNQQEMTNNQIRQAEIIADQMDKAKRQSTTSQALHSVGQNTQGYVRDLKSAEVGNENNKMWFDAINNSSKYFIIGYDANNNPVYQPKDGSGTVITKPKNA